MPTINRLPRKKKNKERTETDIRKLRQKTYATTAWRKLRLKYLKEHPICERCLSEFNKVTPSEDIHHKISPFKGGEVDYNLLTDENNLMSLCKKCHGDIHAEMQGHISPEEVLRQLMDLLDGNISDEELEGL